MTFAGAAYSADGNRIFFNQTTDAASLAIPAVAIFGS